MNLMGASSAVPELTATIERVERIKPKDVMGLIDGKKG
jgi:hypothetical protein